MGQEVLMNDDIIWDVGWQRPQPILTWKGTPEEQQRWQAITACLLSLPPDERDAATREIARSALSPEMYRKLYPDE